MRIVIVEDEQTIRRGLSRMLTKINPGYELVGMADNGLDGLAVVAQQKPDLVILDIQMPRMDGLTMLEQLREQGISCRAIVLTAYSDFNYARRAIELGIENYLLKPIRIAELKRALAMVQEAVDRERGEGSLLSLEQIVRACALGEMEVDEHLNTVTKSRYGLDIHNQMAGFSVWLGDSYERLHGQVELLLAEVCGRGNEGAGAAAKYCIVGSQRFSLVFLLLYGFEDIDRLREYYASAVVPMLCARIRAEIICTWRKTEGMADLQEALNWHLEARKWNLNLKKGTLISLRMLEDMQITELKYPMELETQAKQMLLARDEEGFLRCFRMLEEICREGYHQIEDIRDVCNRYCVAVMNVAREVSRTKEAGISQQLWKRITDALTWKELESVMESIYSQVSAEKEDEDISLLVKRAGQLIEEYYDQGITLEEIAEKLCVSEEYLSTLFKKETGATFTETIRRVRIEKVKELLLHSNLKLNQISDMVGYSDPKYMSRVFRENVGMLPAEFRKMHK